ncbi:MAG TPA: IS110 family transposase [Elusimicrobia bacterium]|nr:IS110 family transposase [Elusimicrobiota bacterium]
MYYVGIDFHKKFSYGTVMDKEGQIKQQCQIANHPDSVKNFINSLDDKSTVVLEATRNWTLMYDWLEDVCEEVKLAHPLKVKVIAEAKVKTDKIDSKVLADLLRTNYLPEAYIPSREARDTRAILRQRMFFVRIQTMMKNRIRTILDRYPEIERKTAEVFTGKGIEWLKGIKIKETDRQIINEDISFLEKVRERIKASDKLIEDLFEKDDRCKRLETIPGIGKFISVLLVSEIDKVERFRDEKKLHAYCGLVPSTYQSGERTIHGRITKQGNKYLRWAMIEAVWPAIRSDLELRNYYERLKKEKGPNRAKVATAKRLLTIVYKVLKDNRNYLVRGCPDIIMAVR